MHEMGYSYCMPEEHTFLPACDSSTVPVQLINDPLPRIYAVNQDFYPLSSMGERKFLKWLYSEA
jgi:hypothetical protein